MAKYLVVAHQTATSEPLVDQLRSLASDDPEASFTLVVPKTHVEHLLTWTEGEAQAVAHRIADEASQVYRAYGLRVEGTAVGDDSPLQAIDDALREGGPYAAIVISTLPAGISRWLKLDVHSQAQKRFNVPVISVITIPDEVSTGKSG
jgi:hypothetical protein